MDFVERWFGVSPDGGTGWYELALFLTLGVILLGVPLLRRKLRRRE